ncbi:MAG: hypothetical protein HQL87_08985 [Magnetococcales bacterium]|nr:hypothetical protein [Magnetococcales bacterium]
MGSPIRIIGKQPDRQGSAFSVIPLTYANPLVGDYYGVAPVLELSTGNILVPNSYDASVASYAGAVRLYRTDGTLLSTLTGSTANDRVGKNMATLTNGNFIVLSPTWGEGTGASTSALGAVTWGNGSTGVSGVVSAANSLVGSVAGDLVGNGGIVALNNGNYVVNSSYWHGGTYYGDYYALGAVTWGSGLAGVSGEVSATNSLVGSNGQAADNIAGDAVGRDGIVALTNGNYVVVSSSWNGGNTYGLGAVTWGSGSAGVSGVVSAANSLVGSTAGDLVGYGTYVVQAMNNGNYAVASPNWSGASGTAVGAVTLGNGTTGTVGAVSASNSFVGTTPYDRVGNGSLLALSGAMADSILVRSPDWSDGTGRVDILRPGSAGPAFSLPQNYATNAGTDSTFAPAQLTALLNAGTNVTLQASNDLTINSAIVVNNPGGNGGILSLASGRSILLNANLTTDDANLNLIANDTAAHGVVDADRSAGTAVITMASGTSLNAGNGTVTIQLLNGAGNTNTTSGDITLCDIAASRISAVNNGGTGGITLASGALTATGAGRAIVLAGQSFTNNAGAAALSATSGNWLVYAASPDVTSKDGLTSAFRHYNATYDSHAPGAVTETGNGFLYASVPGLSVATTLASGSANSTYGNAPTATYGTTLTGFADSEDTMANIGLSGTATFTGAPTAAANAGGYTVSYAGGLTSSTGYILSAGTGLAYTVDKRTVTLSASKSYDGTISLTGAVTINTGITGQALTYTGATANDAHVATANNYINAITLMDGTGLSSNYQLPTLNSSNAPVSISAKSLTPTLTNINVTKTYDGTTTTPVGFTPTYSFAGFVSGDTAATVSNTSAVYNSAHVANATQVTVFGLSITGITGSHNSAATDYALSASSRSVAAAITAVPVTTVPVTTVLPPPSPPSPDGSSPFVPPPTITPTASGSSTGGNPAVSGGAVQAATAQGTTLFGGTIHFGGSSSTIQFSSVGTTLVLDVGGGAHAQGGDNPSEATGQSAADSTSPTPSAAMLLFSAVGSTMQKSGAITVVDQGKTLQASPAASDIISIPTINPATMRSVQVDYLVPNGTQKQIAVGISPEGVLLVKVPPGTNTTMDDQHVTLIGLSIAKEHLNVDTTAVKAVVIQEGE